MRFFILYVPNPAATASAMHPTVIAAILRPFFDDFSFLFLLPAAFSVCYFAGYLLTENIESGTLEFIFGAF